MPMIMNKSPIGITSVVSLTCNGKSKKLSTPISKISDQVNSRCSWFGGAIDVRGIGCICRSLTITTTEN
jgi:hypothetical protein